MSEEVDPLSQIYTALFDLANNSERVKRSVHVGNRVRYDDLKDRNPNKRNVAVGDLPEIVLWPVSHTVNLHSTSSSSSITSQFSWMISSGDLRIAKIHNPTAWALLCAMTRWKETMGQLTWSGVNFVKSVNVLSAAVGMSDSDANRNIKGWSSIWVIEVLSIFKTSHIIDYNDVGS